MKNHFGRFLLVAVICGLSVLAWVRKPPPLGLDLKGGASLTYKAKAEGGELTQEHLTRAIGVIEGRLNATGVAEITITPTQSGEIVVELPGRSAEAIQDIKALIQRNGQLSFRIQAEATEERKQRELFEAGGVKPPPDYMWVPRREPGAPAMLVRTPEKPLENALNKILKKLSEASPEFQAAQKNYDEASAKEETTPEQRAKLKAEVDAVRKQLEAGSEEAKEARAKYEEVVRSEVFTGEMLDRTDIQSANLKTVVFFSFKDERKPWFGQFTEKHIKENMAIILDGKVDSAPVINSKLPGEGIIEGGGTAGFSPAEAKALAIVLESGSTGIQLTLSREESIGPSLGEVAIQRGIWSIIVGLALVVATIFYYYRLPGLVANFALVLNLVILMGVLAFFHAALTLPGIAGIVLTLGMAVDANVLIFERYREERQRGKDVLESVAAGYDRAMSAIIDSNATTILTAVVLIWIGTGAVKGFGVSLTVGLLASMFTSVYVTHWIFDWALAKGIVKDLVLGKARKPPTFDYMRKRQWFTFPSFILMILGVVAYLARDDHEKRDIEFVGGQEAIIQLDKAISPTEADRRIKSDSRYNEASIVTLAAEGVEAKSGETNRFRIRSKAATQEEGDAFLAHLGVQFKDLLVSPPVTELSLEKPKDGPAKVAFTVHTVGDAGDPEKWKAALATAGFLDADVKKDPAAPAAVRVSAADPASNASSESVKARVGEAARAMDPKVTLSAPIPSKSFLEKSRAEQLYVSALWAVLVSLVIEIVYIRIRFADYSHGLAAVVAIIHDVAITLGCVAVADQFGLVYAKVNLVLIAAFLTLIGYSMNDKMVVFDRIRETLGKRRVITSELVNDAINLTLVRSIRTSVTVFAVVLAQSLFSFGTGSALEGFAFVMVIGVVASMYSSIFIAAPLLLFLPFYLNKMRAAPLRTFVMAIATVVGGLMMFKATEPGIQLWAGVLLAFNIPIQFLWYFFPWLLHTDPDSFVRAEIEREEAERPLTKPGI